MKKQFLLFLFSILTCNIFAQSNSIGVFGGIGLNDISVKNYFWGNKDFKTMIGVETGFNYQREFKLPFVLDAGLYYNQCGAKTEMSIRGENNEDLGTTDARWMFDYLSVPILLGFRFGETLAIIPKLGLQASYLIDHRIKAEKQGVVVSDGIDLKYLNRFDLAGVIEMELCYAFNDNWGVFACFSSKYSFTNTANLVKKDVEFYHYSFSTICGVKYLF